eukprot:6243123-Alexandrium_andersonii.AAC.1
MTSTSRCPAPIPSGGLKSINKGSSGGLKSAPAADAETSDLFKTPWPNPHRNGRCCTGSKSKGDQAPP